MIRAIRDVGYIAIGAGLLTAGIVGIRDLAPNSGWWSALVQSSPLIATAAGAVWAALR